MGVRRGARGWRRQGWGVRLWVRPLPAIQLLTGCLIVRSTGRTGIWISLVRTCSGAGQILLLAGRLLAIGLGVARGRKGLPVGAIHGRRLSDAPPDGVGGDKGLRLRRDGREDAVLVEAHAVLAAAVLGSLEARTADLEYVSGERVGAITLALPCDGGSSGRQLQCAGAGRAAGGAAAARTAEAAAVHGTDLAAEGRGSSRWGLGVGRTAAAAAGTGRAGGRSCRVAAPGGEAGASCSPGRRQVSAGNHITQQVARDGADLHARAAGRSRWRAAERWAAASGWAAGLGHPGAETWSAAVGKSG